MHCTLIGNYGTGNLGDEALKEYFLKRFPQIHWTVLSAHPSEPDEVPRLPFGLRSLLCTPWWRTIRALRSSDAVVFGGGSLFTDTESLFACLLWWWHGLVARMFGRPVILAFQGIGPFRTRVGQWCARSTVRHAAFVSVRDEESEARASTFALSRASVDRRVILSFDPVLHLFTSAHHGHARNSVLAVIPRMNSGEALRSAVRTSLERHRPGTVRILSMQPDSAQERRMCAALRRMIGPSASVHPVRTIGELTEVLGGCRHVITERYHGALAAIALGVPVEIISQREGDKLAALRHLQGNPAALAEMRQRVRTGEEELRKFLTMVQ